MEKHSPTIQEYLLENNIDAKVIAFDVPMKTAAKAAEILDVSLGSIFKSIVLTDGGAKTVVAVLPGDKRLNVKELASLVGAGSLQFAKSDLVLETTGYPAGGTPPLGHKDPLPVYVDRTLLDYEIGYGGGGSPELLLEITPAKLVQATNATVCDISE